MQSFVKKIALAAAIFGLTVSASTQATTRKYDFQLNVGAGALFGSNYIDASLDFQLEPEFFFNDHMSVSFRFDGTLGGLDSVHLGGRYRYYFQSSKNERLNFHVGGGIGGVINYDGKDFAELVIPSFGVQYDLTKHIKIGAEVCLSLFFGNGTAFGVRVIPAQFKWTF